MVGPLDTDYTTSIGPTGIVGFDTCGSVSLNYNNQFVVIPVNGCSTFIATLYNIGNNNVTISGSVDGITYVALQALDTTLTPQTILTQNNTFTYPVGGFQFIKIALTFFFGGTTVVNWAKSIANNTVQVVGNNNAALAAQVWGITTTLPQFAGTNTTSRFSFSPLSSLRTEQLLSTAPTYQISANNITPGTAPTDILTLSGSASKIIRITKMIFTSTQTTAGINNWLIVKRSALNSGGTSSTPTIVPSDSTNPAVTAIPILYSVNPTSLGAAVGNIQVQKILSPTPSATTSNDPKIFDFTNGGVDQGVVLRNANELLALNFAGATLPTGLVISVTLQWQEF